MSPYLRVVVFGFSSFEQRTLGSVLRLAGPRAGGYAQVAEIAEADLIVANADAPAVVAAVATAARENDTVFIGQAPPARSVTHLRRPIDAMQVLRELNGLRERRRPDNPPAPVAAHPPAPAAEPRREPPASPVAAPAPVTSAALPPGSVVKALIVDDSAVATRYLQLRLEQLGLDVVLAGNSRQALGLLAGSHFGWVFLDVELGEDSQLDGLALCRLIKRAATRRAQTPPVVVMVSAHQSQLDLVRGTLAGCDHYLAKPVGEAQLRQLVAPPPPKAFSRPRRRAAAPPRGSS